MLFTRMLMCIALLLSFHPSDAGEDAVPQTLEDAFKSLDATLSSDKRNDFQRKPEEQAIVDEHFGLGLLIRNEWFRAKSSKLALTLRDFGARSLDDASTMVLTSYWRSLNNRPIELERQGSCYRKWWEEQRRLEAEATAKGQNSYAMPVFNCSGA